MRTRAIISGTIEREVSSMKLRVFTIATLLVGLLVTSCDRMEPDLESRLYTMTVKAARVETRALTEDSSELPTIIASTWTAGDVIEVWTSDGSSAKYGELTAETSGKSTTFRGTLESLPSDGETLQLKYLKDDYSFQDGTLTGNAKSIDKVSDHALATVVATVEGTKVTTTDASFVNQQAIIRFCLLNKSDFSDLNATGFSISINGRSFTAIPASATNIFYLAIPEITLDMTPLTLTATTGSKLYSWSYNGNFVPTSFENGKYYAVGVALDEYSEATNTLEWLKMKATVGDNCSSYLGWYVDKNGTVSPSSTSDAIGRIAFISNSDVDVAAPGSRVLVMALESAGGNNATYSWKVSAHPDDQTEAAFTDQSAMNGLAFCNNFHSDDYPAAKAAYEYAAARPEGASGWFLPSKGQFNAMMPVASEMLRKESTVAVYWAATSGSMGNAWCYLLYTDSEGINHDQWSSQSKTRGKDSTTATFNARSCFAY